MTRRAQIGCALVMLLLIGGCGGSSQVKPAVYVKSMCQALGNWKNTIQNAGVSLQASGAATAARPVAKEDYLNFVSSLVKATRRAEGDLRSSGVPAVSGGKQLANRLINAFSTASNRLGTAETQAKAIRTESVSTFQLGASAVTTEIKGALEAIAAVAPNHSPQLRQAAAHEPACQVLQG